jgi:hypothetical protein
MTSANSLLSMLRRLDEIERKLDRILEELRTPAAIGYSVRRGDLSAVSNKIFGAIRQVHPSTFDFRE